MREPKPLAAALEALIALAAAEPQLEAQHRRLLELHDQLQRQALYVAVLGQFKRGKSSFLNALLGEVLLPVAVIPLTALPVLLLPGPLSAQVHFQDQPAPLRLEAESAPGLESQLRLYVTEAQNPHNQRKVSFVEVFYPASLLQRGMVLVDTPGIGSTFRHNTETTRQWLPHYDVGLLVLSSEPPITEAELKFIQEIAPQLSELVIVFNKKDTLTPDELAQSLEFLTQVLQTELGTAPVIFAISARQGLQARQSGDAGLWQASGMAQLEEDLLNRLASRKTQLVQTSIQQKTLALAARIKLWLSLWLKAQEEPLQAFAEKIARLDQQVQFLEQEQQRIADLLQVDLRRQLTRLEARAETIRAEAEAFLWPQIEQNLAAGEPEAGVHQLLHANIPPYFDRQMQLQTDQTQQELQQLFSPYRQQLTQMSKDLLQHTGELFGLVYQPALEASHFEIFQDPYWVAQDPAQKAPLFGRWLENLLPPRLRQARLKRRLQQEMKHLLIRNTSNLAWSLQLSLKENFRQFDGELRRQWAETLHLSQETLTSVFHQRQQTSQDAERQTRISEKQAQQDQIQALIIQVA
ncbi:MAG: hypothetical protein CVV27_09675 [Candidatus Melainabacteria bacterium HGW-Melainabacteria-1]|nr:MAG: hypothetical protein CVV27_09675 [Candidatus Melainabacteria bacterium HGW-Melainabacteria-1]